MTARRIVHLIRGIIALAGAIAIVVAFIAMVGCSLTPTTIHLAGQSCSSTVAQDAYFFTLIGGLLTVPFVLLFRVFEGILPRG